jgi:4a-hydroxytetrahydrobiopterin dehydratase
MNLLADKQCREYSASESPLKHLETAKLHLATPEWALNIDEDHISRDYTFCNYSETIEFVILVADIAEQENHHPELFVSYAACRVSYSTHSVSGLTKNDFICAAKIDRVLRNL